MAKETVKKVAELSPVAVDVLEMLKSADAPMTLAEIKETIPSANSAHLTALRTRNLVTGAEVEKIVPTVKKVLAYSVITE